jgi:hypothetical protein
MVNKAVGRAEEVDSSGGGGGGRAEAHGLN